MVTGKLGLGTVLWSAAFAPRRLFDAVEAGQVQLRPVAPYILAAALSGLGSGAELGRAVNQSALSLGLLLGGVALVVSPLAWWIDVRLTHLTTRWFGGQGALAETRAAVGFSSIPALAGLVPYAAFPASIWAFVVRARGLARLHRMKSGRALLAAFSSSFSLIYVGFFSPNRNAGKAGSISTLAA